MPVPNQSRYQDNTFLITPTKQRFPVNESEKQYIVSTHNFLMRKIILGLIAVGFLLGGIYVIWSTLGNNSNSLISPVNQNSPEPSAAYDFIRIDPETAGMPVGWQRIKSKDSNFDIGYDPSSMTATSTTTKIDIRGKNMAFSMELLPYEGGGRQEFILRKMKVIDLTGLGSDANTHEEIYDIGERRALIIYGVDYSGKTIIGMIGADEANAYLIQGTGLTQAEMETFLYTIRVF